MPNFGPTQALTPAEIQELVRTGQYTLEDFGVKTPSVAAPQGPNYKSGSSAAADQRAITGETPLQQRQRQDAQLKALLEARKRKGYAGGGAVLGGLGRLAKRLSGDAPARRGIGNIIKERGGQWLNEVDSPELALRRNLHNIDDPEMLTELKRAGATDAAIEVARAQDNWIKGPLTKYIKRDMGTINDPVRLLADQGITHAQVLPASPMRARRARHDAGMPVDYASTTQLGNDWEDAVDTTIRRIPAKKYQESVGPDWEINKWLDSADPKTKVHSLSNRRTFAADLGIDHLLDEIGNSLDPESGLPEHLQLKPDQLKSGNFSVDAAVRHVAKVNQWRAEQKAAADLERANNVATVLHKDYPDKGFKWVELRAPEGTSFEESFPGNADYKDPAALALRDALKYEGDTMGHCVGGYCEDVASGRSRIYSLRDAKGQPHVTVEVTPPGKLVPITEEMRAERGYLRPHDRFMDIDTGYGHESDQVYPNIVQIKGKGNAKPIDDYIPFVQDFVKSGQWSDVGDIQNAGLVKVGRKYLTPDEHKAILARRTPDGRAVLDQDTLDAEEAMQRQINDWDENRFASGGLININPKKPLTLTVTPDDVLHGNEVDENNAASANQAYNESRERMMAARREDAIAARKLSAIDEIMAELPSSLYVPPPELSASSADPAYSSMEDAVKTMGDWRLGIGQAIASPLLVTDAAEAGLDALRGVKSPSRFRQVSNAISKAFGGPEESANRLEGPHDMQALAASLVNPGNLVSMAKLPKAMMATRGIPRLLKGHSAEAITAPAAQLRQIKDYDDFHKQVSDLSRVQDLRGRHLLGKGASIPDLTTDYLYNWENGGKVYEVLPGPRNKRGWASIAPTEAGKPAYISGIMAEEPGSKDFVNGTFNALLNEIKGPAHATAANGALARYYKSKGIKVGDNWDMNFAKGGKVAPLPAKMRPCDCKPKAMAAGGSVDEEILKLHGY